jgi:hypothetical protein
VDDVVESRRVTEDVSASGSKGPSASSTSVAAASHPQRPDEAVVADDASIRPSPLPLIPAVRNFFDQQREPPTPVSPRIIQRALEIAGTASPGDEPPALEVAPEQEQPQATDQKEGPEQEYSAWFGDFASVFSACAAENPNAQVVRGGFTQAKKDSKVLPKRKDVVEEAEHAALRVRTIMSRFLAAPTAEEPTQARKEGQVVNVSDFPLEETDDNDDDAADDDGDGVVVGGEGDDEDAPVEKDAPRAGAFNLPFTKRTMELLEKHAIRLGEEERVKREVMDIPTPPVRWFRVAPAGRDQVYHLVRLALTQASGGCWKEIPASLGDSPVWHLYWSWGKPNVNRANLLATQKFNHFRHARELTRKDLLKKNLSRYQCLGGKMAQAFAIVPPTFVLPKEYIAFAEAFGRAAFRQSAQDTGVPTAAYGLVGGGTGMGAAGSAATLAARAAIMLNSPAKLLRSTSGASSGGASSDDNLWILKPVGLSRGRGISLVREISDVTYGTPCVLQKYISNPMLLDGYKFDLRVYVLVTSFSPLEAFVYEKGFARVSSVAYSRAVESTYDRAMHLTNSSLQKHSHDKGEAMAIATAEGGGGGTKVSFEYLWKRLSASGVDGAKCWKRVKDVIVKSLVCVDDVIPFQPNCFELFGYDVLLDSEGKASLIEVNASPSLGVDSDLDASTKLALIRDIAKVVDPLPFNHDQLLRTIDQRQQATARARARPHRFGMGDGIASPSGVVAKGAERAKLDSDLSAIFAGATPRAFGAPPVDAGLFTMLCPGSDSYRKVLRLKLSHLAGFQRRAASEPSEAPKPTKAPSFKKPPRPKLNESVSVSVSGPGLSLGASTRRTASSK